MEAIRQLQEGKVNLSDLEYQVELRDDPEEKAKSRTLPQPYQVAWLLLHEGKKVRRGDTVSFVKVKPVRSPEARAILKDIEVYKSLPFAKRWLKGRVDIGLRQLETAGVIRAYPVLKDRGLVSQAEHTLIVTASGSEVITSH